jgi:hypothetical protein
MPALLIPVVAFWGLDGYLLSRERAFCRLYRRIVQRDQRVPPYSMDIKRIGLHDWWSACWRMTLIAFNLKTAVGRAPECVLRGVWQGATRRNSGSIATSCNAVLIAARGVL